MKKLFKKILRFLWPEKRKWNSYTGNTVSYLPMKWYDAGVYVPKQKRKLEDEQNEIQDV